MKNKMLVIGPNSPHVDRFIGLIISLVHEVVFLGEEKLHTTYPVKQHILSFRSFNPFVIWQNSRALKRIVAAENPDIIHIQQVNRVAFLTARALNVLKRKYVITAWGTDVLVIPKKNPVYRRMTKTVLKNAAFITADSKDMVEAIHQLAPGKKTGLVLLGITPLGSEKKEKIVYSNRALFPLYNIQSVVDTFADFYQSNPDWKLVIAGTGPEEQALKERVQKAGLTDVVEFCGWLSTEKNHAWYRKSSIYISLPFSDGTSVSLLEAMSAGCIPVLSDLPVSHEWIRHGYNGVIQRPNENPLKSALQLDSQKAAVENMKLIEERATEKNAANRFSEIYKQVYGV